MQVSSSLPVSAPAAESSLEPSLVRQSSGDIFEQICQQYASEHDAKHRPGWLALASDLVLGKTWSRRVSNLFSAVGLPEFYSAQRNYPVLPESAESHEMAIKFLPRLLTISVDQSEDVDLKPSDIRYEILPPQKEREYFSIVYYVKMPSEEMPISVIGKIYNWIRPLLYGTSHDWEAIQIDFDKTTREPIAMSFETSNYTDNPSSYNTLNSSDLHLYASVQRKSDGTWTHSVQQKNGTVRTVEIESPFREGNHVALSFVSWNGAVDLCDRIEKSELELYPLPALAPRFLDIDTYRKESVDLRMGWLEQRKFAKFELKLPSA